MSTEKYKGKMSPRQSFEIMKMIEAHGTKNGDFWEYEAGWDDERIARELDLNLRAVVYRRLDAFGPTRPSSRANPLEPRIDAIETQMRALRVYDFELAKRVEALEHSLNILLRGMNRDGVVNSEALAKLKEHFNGRGTPTPAVPR